MRRACSRSPDLHRAVCWICALWGALGVVLPAFADDNPRDPATAIIRDTLSALKLNFDEGHIEKAAGAALYEVALDAGTYIYATPDGKYLVAGDLFEVRSDRLVSITDVQRRTRRSATMTGIAPESMIVFAPDGVAAASVVVFTDTDCEYCRTLHSHMEEYLDRGIEVRYAAYPRAGVGSSTYDDMVAAWCAKNPQDALSALKRGERIEPLSCVNPVAHHYAIGKQMGVAGTPTIVVQDGRVIQGLLLPDQLAKTLELSAQEDF